MSKKRQSQRGRPADRTDLARTSRPEQPADRRAQIGLLIVVLILAAIVVIGSDYLIGLVTGSDGSQASPAGPTPTQSAAAAPSQFGVTVQGVGGHWTNVSAAQLATMLKSKDFTLLNVKTPYIGEIDGTDLYIPYDQIKSRAAELPSDKGARILVYCRSGVESAQAAQSLVDLGYTNVWNLDGGMNAWQAAGGQLVQKNR